MATAQMAIAAFEKLLGTHEQPPGSNNVPGITTFLHTANGTGTGNSPWCAETVSYVLAQVGQHDLFNQQFVNGIAYVPYLTALAAKTKKLIASDAGQPGDICIFVWGGPHSNPQGDHTGMVVSRNPDGSYRTIEGNANGADGVGDEVAYHNRAKNLLLGFLRPAYDAPVPLRPSPPPTPTPPHGTPVYPGFTLHLSSPLITGPAVKVWQQQMTRIGYSLQADGIFGPVCEAACRKFQTDHKLTVDGIVGPLSWNAIWA